MLCWLMTIVLGAVLALGLLVRIRYPWVWYDVQHVYVIVPAIFNLIRKIKQKDFLADSFERRVKAAPERVAVLWGEERITWGQLHSQACRLAAILRGEGLGPGDTAALMVLNEPAFIWALLGLQMLGVQVALINYNLRRKALLHCISCCSPKILVVGAGKELSEAMDGVLEELNGVRVLCLDNQTPAPRMTSLAEKMAEVEPKPIPARLRLGLEMSEPCIFIFTSGTTGLPKPAILSHKRVLATRLAFSRPLDMRADDILYETLPLYHGAGLMGLMNVIEQGSTLLLRVKFSASNFWPDCRRHKVTIIHYIGELCRYLVAQPKKPDDGEHNVRVAIGNGLRADIWKEFQTRFRLPRIVEFYAATEGTGSFVNLCNKIGVLGRCSPLLRKVKLESSILVKYDTVTEQPVRGADGRCIPISPGEEGLLVSKLSAYSVFEGYYRRPEDSKRKVLTDVLEPGDRYFNSGDILFMDHDYFLSFRDRTGDTFRWKGENVSTSEVSNVLNGLPFVHDTNVYGVRVPGCEGRAGMAAIHLTEGEDLGQSDLDQVTALCQEQLPPYARPKFLRVQRQMSLTSTFKQQKTDLVEEAFDPQKVNEPLYVYDNRKQGFKPINEDVFQEIVHGEIPL